MDRKILILKNDRVGDLFHSLRNIEHLIKNYSNSSIEIYLSNINIRFSKILNYKNVTIKKFNFNLTIYEKFSLLLKLLINKYDYVLILTPKSFYFYLPILFKKVKFLGICVDGKQRNRPNKFLRKYLYKYEVNDRSNNKSKQTIYNLEKKLLNQIISNFDKINLNNKVNKNAKKNSINILFHYKSELFGDIQENLQSILNIFLEITATSEASFSISTDLELKNSYNLIIRKIKNYEKIRFLGSVEADELINVIGGSDIVISPHGAISCIGAYYDKHIIDIFDRNITRNAFREFKPHTNGHYQFIFKSENKNVMKIKLLYKINNLIKLVNK